MKKILISINILLGAAILAIAGYIIILFSGQYAISKKDLLITSSTKIVDEDGHELSKLYLENREIIPISKVPKKVQDAFIATEDSRFYHHGAIDFQGTLRALMTDLISGSKAEGGSTITQQLAKNIFLTNEKSFFRKAKEAAIAVSLERKYSKKEILGMYLNEIYFGHGAYGISSAAKFYFNKKVSDLTIEEGAMLAALVKAPSNYSPITHPDAAIKRRNLVLHLMGIHHYLPKSAVDDYQNKKLGLDLHKPQSHPEYYTYIDMVLDEAEAKYHLSNQELLRGGYKIVVPMSRQAEIASYQAFKKDQYFKGSTKGKTPNGAFVLMNPKNGGVLAVQGGRHYVKKGLNHVTVKRQPGSTFKPLAVYGPALNEGDYKPYSLLTDKKIVYHKYEDYTPENYDHQYTGKMTMYDALTYSANAPAVWLLNQIGIEKSKSYLKKLGFNLPDNGLAIALGGLKTGVTPLQLASAYTAFANDGIKVQPHFIDAIYDRDGHLIGKADSKSKKVFSKQTAWYMTKMLESVVQIGTGSAGTAQTELAGKTGSTGRPGHENGLRDAWFAGYTPKAAGVVWIGYGKTTEDQYVTGSSEDATRLFKDIINQIPAQQGLEFEKPDGVKDLQPPIHLQPVSDFQVTGTLGKYGLPGVELTWTPDEDPRVIYHIYEMKDGSRVKIAEVKGKGEFTVNYVNPFQEVKYQVVPYNPLTQQEGRKSSAAAVNWFGGF